MTNASQLYDGVAEDYLVYRHSYPSSLLEHLASLYSLDGTGTLLDVGCGTGTLTFPLSPYFNECLGIDINKGMIAAAQGETARRGLEHVRFELAEAESIASHQQRYRMVTFGSSFHWLDQPRVSNQVSQILEPNGVIAIFTIITLQPSDESWKVILNDCFKRHSLDNRTDIWKRDFNPISIRSCLAQAGFVDIKKFQVSIPHTYSVNSLLGFLRTTSFASKARLGNNSKAFADDLRKQLSALSFDDSYSETVDYQLVSARRAPVKGS